MPQNLGQVGAPGRAVRNPDVLHLHEQLGTPRMRRHHLTRQSAAKPQAAPVSFLHTGFAAQGVAGGPLLDSVSSQALR